MSLTFVFCLIYSRCSFNACDYYKLYQLEANGTEREVPLFSIPDTANLAGSVDEENKIVFKGLKGMLALKRLT